MTPAKDFDVAVIGASIAGCTAARLFAQRGLRVALIERRHDLDAYKTTCTHFIQSSATPTIERLGLAPLLERRGAVHNSIDFWAPHGGWIVARLKGFGYSLTRRELDPMLRRLAAETPGVALLAGWTAIGQLGEGRPRGVRIENSAHEVHEVRARLLVAADGRGSKTGRFAGVRARSKPNRRFFYWAYWSGVRPAGTQARVWILEPDCAYTFPNEDGLTLALVAPHQDRLPEFQADREGAYMRMLRSLPDAPEFDGATRESKLLGKLDVPSTIRPAARPGLAFVGDAALAADPFWGVGCGWAFQSSEWLVEETAPALRGEGDLDAALDRYRRLHRWRLGPHYIQTSDFSTAREITSLERRALRQATVDPVFARSLVKVFARERSVFHLLNPRVAGRLLIGGAGRSEAA
jgi:2-polyprenyl-6-methoxyphenol hydroxylase-like FAD-dependent oxidoreductase